MTKKERVVHDRLTLMYRDMIVKVIEAVEEGSLMKFHIGAKVMLTRQEILTDLRDLTPRGLRIIERWRKAMEKEQKERRSKS